MNCGSCGTPNEAGRKFCGECGAKLSAPCPTCGTPNAPGVKFCGECGTKVGDAAPIVVGEVPLPVERPTAERRLVSVLFADLVGFTTLSEARDSEEVRELLTRYFDTCRTLITRYGGTIEKFIGDAVMAVWGTPVATEHDAERAVRAALDLTAAVSALGDEVGAPELAARAGVLTGEAAVTLGAEGQGMVAGDLVNTASRIQSAAAPGQVLVGEVTKRSSEDTVVYEDAGTFELKGKSEPAPLWHAVRVVAGAKGTMRSAGLEAPFVGRDRELRMIKDLFHASAEERRPHLVTVLGVAGTGKSRLVWEFFKYIDGLADTVRWHRGRCLPYGEGVTYWALAEMLRTRAGILEGEDPASSLRKLHEALEASLPDPEERAWVEPRVAHLLGLEDRVAREREDLFAAWRLLYERLSEEMPTVLVFEDLQWADPSLLDFIEYLMEWSREHRLFVFVAARPELLENRATWGSATRNATSLRLEPLADDAMSLLLSGLAPGLPEELRAEILQRAEGVPLYAVETVRMLIDRGMLSLEGNAYRLTGTVEALDVPETLHALISARLDGLTPQERRLVQDGAVLGKTFTRQGLALLSGLPEGELEPLLVSLVRKEVLFLQADPRSPERGQHGFLQDLVKFVAYETLSKRERKAKHLAAAVNAASGPDAEELSEVIAAHYVEAYRAAPDASDAPEIKAKARDALERAGERAASLAATLEAQRLFDHAAELTDDDRKRADLLERAGRMAHFGARYVESEERLRQAVELFAAAGDPRRHAGASAVLGETEWYGLAKIEEPLRRMEEAYEVLSGGEPDEALAALAGEIARFQYFAGHVDGVMPWIERALDIAEALWLPEVLSNVLNTKSLVRRSTHPEEAFALILRAVTLAEENGLANALVRAINNLGVFLAESDRTEEALETFIRQREIAHRLGVEQAGLVSRASELACLVDLGRWSEALQIAEELWPEKERAPRDVGELAKLVIVHGARGEVDRGRTIVEAFAAFGAGEEPQMRAAYNAANASQLLVEGRTEEALAAGELAIADAEVVGINSDPLKWAYACAMEAAATLGAVDRLEALIAAIESIPKGLRSPLLGAQATRFRAHVAARGGDGDASTSWKTATGALREIGATFWVAASLVEHGEWLAMRGGAEAVVLLEEARGIMEQLQARRWLERIDAAAPERSAVG